MERPIPAGSNGPRLAWRSRCERLKRVGRIAVDQARGSQRLSARTGRQASSPMSMADASIEAMEDVRDHCASADTVIY